MNQAPLVCICVAQCKVKQRSWVGKGQDQGKVMVKTSSSDSVTPGV